MKIDQNYKPSFPDQTLESNRRMNKVVGTTSYQANKVIKENERIQDILVENAAKPSPNSARDMFSTVLKKLNII
ncbi:MAG: hypothetical protein COW00_16210 [Bdellovibrio sp. CG12_big_fil_rev_8_21_14_0_65_39_13]|nr:MAG: hypothetical protein COW78_02590 [Bdellovibrio sp. CG22_combo_CG10-13_8_21_14_all_39_27]PIQ58386.1 MAG: hypothetical protein COW00_16210 [Bdellovibrio sp. CG12_big_fil_rev_8_21_14_0_65_39_13]PIR35899.1 MAG: hypothetical protein COV37_06795 [Bdellovibrio sp. CG11_big_fil_rev_8_21_14_0_20_39_38]